MSSVRSVKSVKTCAYCKEEGHFIRASRDQSSAITCPLLQEKEKKRKGAEVSLKKKEVAKPLPSLKKLATNLFAEAFAEEQDEHEGEVKVESPVRKISNKWVLEFPELPTLNVTTPVKKQIPEKSYAYAASLLTPEKEVASPEIKAPGAPVKKPMETKPKFTNPYRITGRWADYESSDEEEEEDAAADRFFA